MILTASLQVLSILQNFTERTPGSYLELKDSGLTWHFKDADADFGLTQAKNLQLHFDQMLQVHTSNKLHI
jgi:trehalose 6-phosphate synthase/phosphatase